MARLIVQHRIAELNGCTCYSMYILCSMLMSTAQVIIHLLILIQLILISCATGIMQFTPMELLLVHFVL